MARTFTMVACNDFSILKPDFIESDELSDIEGLVMEVSETPSDQTIDVEVFYMAFLDTEGSPVEPATSEEIEILTEKLSDFLDAGYIQIVDSLVVPITGSLEDDDIVELIEV